MDDLAISVVVPLSAHRRVFFERYCLPSIEANNPAQVIIVDGEDTAAVKRNKGAEQATQPYLFFCDDDIILSGGCLALLLEGIGDHAFAYCGYRCVDHPEGTKEHRPGDFSVAALRDSNYISTMSLVRAELFPGFDERLTILDDWDLWLSIVGKGGSGAFVDTEFIAFYNGPGITQTGVVDTIQWRQAVDQIRAKHDL